MMRKNRTTKKSIALLASLAVMLTVTVGGTLAYLIAQSETVTNSFDPANVSCVVEADATNKTFSVKNTSDIDAYLRAAIVVNWADASGDNVYGIAPVENSDYTLAVDTENWVEGNDGYWYYKTKVAPFEKSADVVEFITSYGKQNGVTAPEGYSLQVEVLAQAIQALPDEAVEETWSNDKVTVDANNGTLTIN